MTAAKTPFWSPTKFNEQLAGCNFSSGNKKLFIQRNHLAWVPLRQHHENWMHEVSNIPKHMNFQDCQTKMHQHDTRNELYLQECLWGKTFNEKQNAWIQGQRCKRNHWNKDFKLAWVPVRQQHASSMHYSSDKHLLTFKNRKIYLKNELGNNEQKHKQLACVPLRQQHAS